VLTVRSVCVCSDHTPVYVYISLFMMPNINVVLFLLLKLNICGAYLMSFCCGKKDGRLRLIAYFHR